MAGCVSFSRSQRELRTCPTFPPGEPERSDGKTKWSDLTCMALIWMSFIRKDFHLIKKGIYFESMRPCEDREMISPFHTTMLSSGLNRRVLRNTVGGFTVVAGAFWHGR